MFPRNYHRITYNHNWYWYNWYWYYWYWYYNYNHIQFRTLPTGKNQDCIHNVTKIRTLISLHFP